MFEEFGRFGPEIDGWGNSAISSAERKRILSFEPVIGSIASGIGDALSSVGVGADTAATIGTVAAPALIGAGGGALVSGVTGGNPLIGALGGGALGGLYGGYNAAGGLSGLKDALGLGTSPQPVPGQSIDLSSGTPQGDTSVPYGSDQVPAQAAEGKPALPIAEETAPTTAPKLTKGINTTSLALGALAALGSALAKQNPQPFNPTSLPGPSSTAATQGPLFNQPMNPHGYITRTPTTPTLPGMSYNPADPSSYGKSYFSYGPTPTFFSNNAINLGLGYAHGGPAHEPFFETGGDSRLVRGPGDGQSDSVNARLSDGEYVMTAADVSRIGGGSNEAGAKRLDEMRQRIAKDTGSKKIQPKPKSPLTYLRKAS